MGPEQPRDRQNISAYLAEYSFENSNPDRTASKLFKLNIDQNLKVSIGFSFK